MTKSERLEMEKVVYETFDRLDPTGANTGFYKELFSKMNDSEFDKFMERIADDPKAYLIKHNVDYEIESKMEYIEKAAEYLNVPLFEKVVLPCYSPDPNHPIVTKYEVPVIMLHDKRMQQAIQKKNGLSTDITSRDKYNQVANKDKNGRNSDTENFGLTVLQADNIQREFNGPRADDQVDKSVMYQTIYDQGYCSLEHLPNDIKNKTTLNYIDAILLSMGLKSDLITKGNILQQSLEDE